MSKRIRAILLIGFLLVVAAIPLAASANPGTPTAQVVCLPGGNAASAQTRIDFSDITGTGAAGFTLVFTLPDVGVAPVIGQCANSGAFATLPGCVFFDCNVVDRQGGNFSIEGVCLAGSPGNLTGNVQGPTINLTNSGAVGQKTVDLLPSTGPVISRMFDAASQGSDFTDDRLIDGYAAFGVDCSPTAVTMSGFDATTDSPAPFAAAAWPLLAGAAAVAAGGAYALLRRKS